VDNILIFCDGCCRDSLKLRDILDPYYLATGMQVSVGNHIVSSMGICEEDKNMFSQIFPYPIVELLESIKYLSFYLKPSDYTKKIEVGWYQRLRKGCSYTNLVCKEVEGEIDPRSVWGVQMVNECIK
jgi:hypothetical protein